MGDVELSLGQIFCFFPDDDDQRLNYHVQHPFVKEQDCRSCCCSPCECSDDESETQYYRCTLCGREDMNETAAECHLSEPSHMKLMRMSSTRHIEYRSIMSHWKEIHSLPSLKRLNEKDVASLPDSVLAATYRYVRANYDRKFKQRTSRKAATLLRKYENMERLALLHLTVWKVQCLWQIPRIDSLLAATDWMTSGWKELKSEQRQSGVMHTIVSLVHPFL